MNNTHLPCTTPTTWSISNAKHHLKHSKISLSLHRSNGISLLRIDDLCSDVSKKMTNTQSFGWHCKVNAQHSIELHSLTRRNGSPWIQKILLFTCYLEISNKLLSLLKLVDCVIFNEKIEDIKNYYEMRKRPTQFEKFCQENTIIEHRTPKELICQWVTYNQFVIQWILIKHID